MGMFTSCFDELGQEHQIKCGHDECEFLRIGEYVKSCVIERHYGEGYLLDGVYQGYSRHFEGEYENSAVVIKKCRLHTIIQPDKVTGDEFVEYGIRNVSKYHWSLEVFEQHQKKQQEYELEFAREVQKDALLSPQQRLANAMIRPLMRMRDYSSIARALTPVEQLDEKTLQLQSERIKLEEQQKLITKFDVIEIISKLNLYTKNPDEIEELICKALFGIIPAGFLVYAYPEQNDIDVVLSMYLGSGHILFQCPVSQLVKGVDSVYRIHES